MKAREDGLVNPCREGGVQTCLIESVVTEGESRALALACRTGDATRARSLAESGR